MKSTFNVGMKGKKKKKTRIKNLSPIFCTFFESEHAYDHLFATLVSLALCTDSH